MSTLQPSFLPKDLQERVSVIANSSYDIQQYKAAKQEAQRNLDITRLFLKAIFNIELTDLSITSEILLDTPNAFASWEERKVSLGMAHFDGDDGTPACFTSLDIVAHETAHIFFKFLGIDLEYEKQPGAIEENAADFLSIMARLWAFKEKPEHYNGQEREWSVGDRIVKDLLRCDKDNCYLDKMVLRCFIEPGSAYRDHPYFGDDPQRLVYKNLDEYITDEVGNRIPNPKYDHGAVHSNSAILNNIFYKWCTECRISPLEVGKIWIHTLREMSRPNMLQALVKHGIITMGTIEPTQLSQTRLVRTLVEQNVLKASPPRPSEVLQALVDHNIIGISDEISSPKILLQFLANDGAIKASEQSPTKVLQALITQEIIHINCGDDSLQSIIEPTEKCTVNDFLVFLKHQKLLTKTTRPGLETFLGEQNISPITTRHVPTILQFFIRPLLLEKKLDTALSLLQQLEKQGVIKIKDSESTFTFKRLAAKICASPCILTAQARENVKKIFDDGLGIAFSGQGSPKRRSATLPPDLFDNLERRTLADAFNKLLQEAEEKKRPGDQKQGTSPKKKKRKLFLF